MKFKLKENLLLGTATAATQIEGGDYNNNWAQFAEDGKVDDGTSPVRACDHYNRWREDIDLMAEMGMQIYRFGIEWSRIEPYQGDFREDVLEHYREEIIYMKEKGIKPLLTLHHFSNPLWFEEEGGWTNPESVDIFLNFADQVIDYLGDVVDEYITINEPNVYCLNGYFYGIWPPEKKSIGAYSKALSNMSAAHVKCYQLIRNKRAEMGKSQEETLVSFANHLRVFAPQNYSNPWHRFCARFMEHMFQGAVTEAMMRGKCTYPIMKRPGLERGRYYDFIGVNYYSRSTVSGIENGVAEDCYKNDLGWEIYHEGLIDLTDLLSMEYGFEYPVYVTENGTCDNTDSFRSRFIYDQLKLISETDNRIERYYHWSFTDNFEWREGESARFGIVHIDYETQKRTVKESGMLYSDIINNQGVTDEAYKAFVETKEYHK